MEWARRSGERDARDLMERLSAGFFTLLDELTIARSRKHIQKYYRASMAQIGQFPGRRKPESVFSGNRPQRPFSLLRQAERRDRQLSAFHLQAIQVRAG